MAAEVSVCDDQLVIEVQGLHKIWALKSRMEIPLVHVKGVRWDPEVASTWFLAFKAGTHLPGVIAAGTFWQHEGRVFWDVHDPEMSLIIDLADEYYAKLIIEVADPEAVFTMIQAAIAK